MSEQRQNHQAVVEKIKERGYWNVIIEPTKEISRFFEHIIDAKSLVSENTIRLRGWDYPHFPTKKDPVEGVSLRGDRLDGYIDWNHFIEAWTFYQSGQFAHLLGLREDWFKESNWFEEDHRLKQIEPMTVLDFIGTTLSLTEMFLFAKNLSKIEQYGGSIRLIISLHNVEGRMLQVLDPSRTPIFASYKSTTDTLPIVDEVFTRNELEENHLALARRAAVNTFKYFEWAEPPDAVIEEVQQKLITRTL